jgi:hypothetical protein
MLSGIWTACGNGEVGNGRWPKETLVGVGVAGDVATPSSFLTSTAMGVLTGRKVEAIARGLFRGDSHSDAELARGPTEIEVLASVRRHQS